MYKKAISLLVAFIALAGFSLAAFIPGASAQKARDVYTQYCEYAEYSQYCEPPATTTTVVNGTTTESTSSTITVAPPTTSTATSPSTTTTTTAPSSTGSAAIVLGVNGVASITVAVLKPGQAFVANGVAVTVLAFSSDGVTVSFGGVTVDVPTTAAVSVSKDGTVTVTYFIVKGKLVPAIKLARAAAAFKPLAATGQQDIILPKGKSSSSFAYTLTKGVSFGAKTTWSQIAKDITVQATGTSALRAKAAKLANVAHTVSANKSRSAVTVKLAKSERSFIIKLNVGKLQYSAAEQAYIAKHKVKTLSPKFTVKATAATTTALDTFAFTYPV